MHPLGRNFNRLGEACGKGVQHAVEVNVGVNAIRHAGHVDFNLGGREAVNRFLLGEVSHIFQIFRGFFQRACGAACAVRDTPSVGAKAIQCQLFRFAVRRGVGPRLRISGLQRVDRRIKLRLQGLQVCVAASLRVGKLLLVGGEVFRRVPASRPRFQRRP